MTPDSGHLGDLLSALLDGELPADERARASAHLAACADCSAELEAVGQARQWVRDLPSVSPLAEVYDLVARQQRRRRGVTALAGAAAAAAALVMLRPPVDAPVAPPVYQLVEDHAASASVAGDPVSQLVPVGVPVSFSP